MEKDYTFSYQVKKRKHKVWKYAVIPYVTRPITFDNGGVTELLYIIIDVEAQAQKSILLKEKGIEHSFTNEGIFYFKTKKDALMYILLFGN